MDASQPNRRRKKETNFCYIPDWNSVNLKWSYLVCLNDLLQTLFLTINSDIIEDEDDEIDWTGNTEK